VVKQKRAKVGKDNVGVRTAENNSEFGDAARAGKVLRLACGAIADSVQDGGCVSRLTKVMKAVQGYDVVGVRGGRRVGVGIESAGGKAELVGFEFNGKVGFDRLVGLSRRVEWLVDGGSGTVLYRTVLGDGVFRLSDVCDVPEGATDYRIEVGVAIVDFEAERYWYKGGDGVIMGKVDEVSVSNILNMTVAVEVGMVRVGLIKVSFYQELNGRLYALEGVRGGACMVQVVG
jgi:hypothetical protein